MHPMLASIFIFYVFLGSFSYTSRVGFIFIWSVSFTRPVLVSFVLLFILYIYIYLFFHLGNFSYTSNPGFIFISGVFLIYPTFALLFFGEFSYAFHAGFYFSFSSGEFLLHIPCWLPFGGGGGIWGASLAHSLLPSFLYGECLLHIPYWLHYYLGIFSYISHAGFIFI